MLERRRDPSWRGLDDVAVLLEQPAQEADEPRVVLDDEQVHGGQPTAFAYGTTVTSSPVRADRPAPARRRLAPCRRADAAELRAGPATFEPAVTSAAVAGACCVIGGRRRRG